MRKPRPAVRPLAALAAGLLLLSSAPVATPAASPRVVPLIITWNLTPAQITSSCATELASVKQRIDAMVHQRSARTFDTVFATYERIGADAGDHLAAQQLLFIISPDAAVRAASEQCSNDVGNVFAAESARPDIYRAMVAAKASNTARTADDRKLEELDLVAAQRSGAGLAPAQRREFVALEQKITGLETTYETNLNNDATTIAITPAQAANLPADFTANLKTDPSGNVIVPVNESTVETFDDNQSDAAARKAYSYAYNRRGGEANVTLLETALVARERIANLLGYPNWSSYVAADKMVKTSAHIASFLSTLDAALLPATKPQLATLAALKGAPLDSWDVGYYENQLLKTKYSVDSNVVKQYFPAQHTIDAVLAIYAKILGLTFTLAPNAPVWDKSVYAYDVTDTATGEYRGRFYLDLYPRPGKFSHFANVGPTARRIMPDGSIRPAVNVIVGNWPAPAGGKPSLLSHDDVTTFFHEFGHNVAALCANTPYETLNSGFRSDFTEAPSQMLENFTWDPAILKQISSNVDTGAPLPGDLIAKMIAARYADEPYETVEQDFVATVDQRYHSLRQPIDATAVWATTEAALTPFPMMPGTFPEASFEHLMSGYEGGYYGYLYSKVYAQDMFTAFQAGGLESPVVGARYRNDILAPARSEEPDDEVRAFLGRPMSPDAFYRQLGIAVPK
jgi:Zn-dependent oligopeptidase